MPINDLTALLQQTRPRRYTGYPLAEQQEFTNVPQPSPPGEPMDLGMPVSAPYPVDSMRYAYQDLLAPPPPPPQVSKHTGGFKSRLKDAAAGFAVSGGSPLFALLGLIAPQLIHNARYNLVDKPRYEADQQFDLAQKKGRIGNITDVGAMTGYDPLTGLPTAKTQSQLDLDESRQAMQEYRNQSLALRQDLGLQGLELGRLRLGETQRSNQASQLNRMANGILSAYKTGARLGPAQYGALIASGRISSPEQLPEIYDPKEVAFFQDAQGNVTASRISRQGPQGNIPLGNVGRPSAANEPPRDAELYKQVRDEVYRRWHDSGKIKGPSDEEKMLAQLLGQDEPQAQYDEKAFDAEVDAEYEKRKGKVGKGRTTSLGPSAVPKDHGAPIKVERSNAGRTRYTYADGFVEIK